MPGDILNKIFKVFFHIFYSEYAILSTRKLLTESFYKYSMTKKMTHLA